MQKLSPAVTDIPDSLLLQQYNTQIHSICPTNQLSSASFLRLIRGIRQRRHARRLAVLALSVCILSYAVTCQLHSLQEPDTLQFKNASLEEAIEQIESKYDIDVYITDSCLLNKKITCTFFYQENVAEILRCICVSVKARLSRSSSITYRINRPDCSSILKKLLAPEIKRTDVIQRPI